MFCCVYVFVPFMPDAQRPEKGVRSPELKLLKDASHSVGAGKKHRSSVRPPMFLTAEPSLTFYKCKGLGE